MKIESILEHASIDGHLMETFRRKLLVYLRWTISLPAVRILLVTALFHTAADAPASVVRSWSMQHRWPKQTVYYYLDERLDEETGEPWYRKLNEQSEKWTYDQTPELWSVPLEQTVTDGLQMLRWANPGLKFINIGRPDADRFPHAVKFTKRSETSLVGMATATGYSNGQSKRYEIHINKWCHAGIVAHEMMHILGMSHIQCRPDRDTHAIVFTGQTYLEGTPQEFTVPDNVRSGHGNFSLLIGRRMLGAYDFDSIMHYSDSVMKKNPDDESLVRPKVTIGKRINPGPLRGVDDSQPETGIHYFTDNGNGRSYYAQRSHLSAIDRWALREMYYHTYQPETGADFNGDGFADLIVGSASQSAANGRSVRVLYGGAFDSKRWGLNIENVSAATKQFSLRGDEVRHSTELRRENKTVVSYGDFNGDYRMDAVIGRSESGTGAGAVHVIYGAQDNDGRDGRIGLQRHAQGDDLEELEWSGLAGEGLGAAIAVADFNGDGYSDLAVSAPNSRGNESVGNGKFYVHFGSKAGLTTSFDQVLEPRDTAEIAERFGTEIAIGDFNGDGYSDMAVAAPDDDLGAEAISNAGSVFVFRGSEGGLLPTAARLHQGLGSIPDTPEPGDRWGSSLDVADFDADGLSDLVIANHSESIDVGDRTVKRAGLVTVIYGERGDKGIHAQNQRTLSFSLSDVAGDVGTDSGFGYDTAAADFNGDGFSDLAIGSPFQDSQAGLTDVGAVYIVNGGPEGISVASTVEILPSEFKATAPSNGAQIGWSLSNGDFDGNGYVDLVIGMPGQQVDGIASAGQIVVRYHGSPYDSSETPIGRSFPAYVAIDHAAWGAAITAEPRERFGAVLP